MDANEDVFMEELLTKGRDPWDPLEVDGFFATNWGFDTFKPNPFPYDPPLIPTSFDYSSTQIKPDLDCPFDELYGQFDVKFTTPNILDHQNYTNLDETLQFCTEEDYLLAVGEDNNVQSLEFKEEGKVGLCVERKNKRKQGGQPSKNLMAERRRRKRLNDRLSMLRSVVPKISKMDRTAILGDTIDYIKELSEKISNIQEQVDVDTNEANGLKFINDHKQDDVLGRNSAKFHVKRIKADTLVEISCGGKSGILLSTISTLEGLGLDIQQCVISCFNDFSLHASCSEELGVGTQVSSEDIKQELFRNAGYGGMCM